MSMYLDPRTKIISFIILFTLVFIAKDVYYFLALTAVAFIITVLNKHEIRFLRSLVKFIPILFIAFIMWSLFHNLSLFHVYIENSNIGIFMTTRLLALISISLSFILTIKPEELIKALEAFNFPYTMAFTLGLSLRYISTISDEYRTIKEAQISRGLELDSGSLIKRIRNYTYVLIPLLIRSIETTEKLILAMELKAFSLRKNRYKKHHKLKPLDYVIIISLAIVLLLSINYYIFGVI